MGATGRQIAPDGASRAKGCYSEFDVNPLSSFLSLPKYVGHQLFQIALGGFALRRLFVHFSSVNYRASTAASYPLLLVFFAPPFFALGTVSAPHRT
jgi:hypothetical protein